MATLQTMTSVYVQPYHFCDGIPYSNKTVSGYWSGPISFHFKQCPIGNICHWLASYFDIDCTTIRLQCGFLMIFQISAAYMCDSVQNCCFDPLSYLWLNSGVEYYQTVLPEVSLCSRLSVEISFPFNRHVQEVSKNIPPPSGFANNFHLPNGQGNLSCRVFCFPSMCGLMKVW